MSDIRHEVRAFPGWDERSKDHGVHGVTLMFATVGPAGAIALEVSTGWYPDSVGQYAEEPLVELVYHAREETGGGTKTDECCFVEGGCWSDGGFALGRSVFEALKSGGEPALWDRLDTEYFKRFG